MYLYKIINGINNKSYIGQATDIKRRWNQHKSSARAIINGTKTIRDAGIQVIHLAMAKYGIENFSFEILEEMDTWEATNERETYWVSYYDSLKGGYNCTPGGYNAPKTEEWKRKVKATRMANGGYGHSEETKKLISDNWYSYHNAESIKKCADAKRGRALSDEHKRKLSEVNKGNQYCLGHKQSEKTIQKRMKVIAAQYGDKICNAPNCARIDGFKVDGVRYCNLHVQRLKNTGILGLGHRTAPNKDKKLSEETKAKISNSKKGQLSGEENPFYGKKHSKETIDYLRQINLNKEPPNKKQFSDEQIQRIIADVRSLRKIAKDFGVSTTVIRRVKRENV